MNAQILEDSSRPKWKIDPGTILALVLLVVSGITSYTVLSFKVDELDKARVEDRTERRALTDALHNVEGALIRLQTQVEERKK